MAHPFAVGISVTSALENLVRPDVRPPSLAPNPEMDPLVLEDALVEGQLLDVRFDAMRKTIGALFDFKGGLQLREGNTAVLVAVGVENFEWNSGEPSSVPTVWPVMGSRPHTSGHRWAIDLSLLGNGGLGIVAQRAHFYGVDVPGMDDAQPVLDEADDATVRTGFVSWHSPFTLVNATSFEGTL
ncbi:hypothetical protein FE697_017200 [Mumia zhuanghuii]|uniref:Uncharacterized protein n=2 Tax=Mumia TaxID=1546255 RepID=A0ABW1QMD8_9ACTN|nr:MULTISPECIES: hypothetical protein [Mumia]KAA1420679.1 hypothetical protein FE697_017200 [Mumia zhuanghuii]